MLCIKYNKKNFSVNQWVLWIAFYLAFMANAVYANRPLENADRKYKLSVCAVFQNESFFLHEWIEFHKLMGVKHFYLYNNLSTDNYMEILEPYIDSKEVTLVEWPIETHNQKEYIQLLQLPVYNHALEIAKHEAEWIAFIDLDEFLFPMQHLNLIDLLKDYKSYAGLAVNWQLYGTSWWERLPDDGLITEHLILKAPTFHASNQLIKMLVQPSYVKTIENPHYFNFYTGYYSVDSAGRILPYDVEGQPVNVDIVRINHYWCGTLEWLMTEKIPRRKKWGFNIPEDLIISILNTYNQVHDDSIYRFIPKLREAMNKPNKKATHPRLL
ncbi:MAG: glycosyltransferase family 92 protein [Parachlamydiaceae bacterium]|nr:glycosyltransferase family 92 protein [Parachlamydiaceae bacterium]